MSCVMVLVKFVREILLSTDITECLPHKRIAPATFVNQREFGPAHRKTSACHLFYYKKNPFILKLHLLPPKSFGSR